MWVNKHRYYDTSSYQDSPESEIVFVNSKQLWQDTYIRCPHISPNNRCQLHSGWNHMLGLCWRPCDSLKMLWYLKLSFYLYLQLWRKYQNQFVFCCKYDKHLRLRYKREIKRIFITFTLLRAQVIL